MRRFLLVYCPVFILLTSCSPEKDQHSDNYAYLQQEIDSLYASSPESVGMLVHIEYPKKNMSWTGAAGISNKATNAPLLIDQPFLIASNTKTYVAAAIIRLAEQGKLDVDASVSQFLSDSTKALMSMHAYDLEGLKVKHLLSHTSGINDYVDASYFEKQLQENPNYKWTREEQIELAIGQMDKVDEPGGQYKYSDTNYLLLSEIIEQQSGMVFYEAINKLLGFKENGLENTWFEGLEAAPGDLPALAHQYIESWGLDAYDLNKSFDLYGGGGLAATVEDLAVFTYKLFNNQLFDQPESSNLLLSKVKTDKEANDDYRFGIFVSEIKGEICYMHGGFWGTMVFYFPERDLCLSVAVLNQDTAYLRKTIAKLMHKELFKTEL